MLFLLTFFFVLDAQADAGDGKCSSSAAINRSSAAIKFILDDIRDSYSHTGGGGITRITEYQTDSFEVSISQEERIDILRYQVLIGTDCKVTLVKKEESVKSF